MALDIATRVFTVERQFIKYDSADFKEIYAFLNNEHGVLLQPVDFYDDEATKYDVVQFRSESGSTSHYIHSGDYIVIDETGEVRAMNEKDA